MAQDILIVLTSNITSESAFNTESRTILDFLSRLTPKTVEALGCNQDWIREASGIISLLLLVMYVINL